jgi:uncharacterized beta-barrel protein YwiB (DUF1934 family)
MQPCQLTITTVMDGNENSIVRKGTFSLSLEKCVVCYREENADVQIVLQGETAFVERRGDYTLRLTLERGKESVGVIGLGGADGEIATYARRVVYSMGKDSLLLSLHYDLLISGETQEMKLRLYAKAIS